MFITKCPSCDVEDDLVVSSGVFMARGMALCEDGFSFSDAKGVDTEEEVVRCLACGGAFDLADLHYNDEPPPEEVRLKIKERGGG